MSSERSPKFSIGQLVHHKMFDYHGVIIDVDDVFKGSDEWYSIVARSHPPKDRSWYHVLMYGTSDRTYVAERNLEPDKSDEPINHPEIIDFFSDSVQGLYLPESIN
ncbi:MAG TPA: heat shock protein HspQ [Thermodesulfobacteriota bacterium]